MDLSRSHCSSAYHRRHFFCHLNGGKHLPLVSIIISSLLICMSYKCNHYGVQAFYSGFFFTSHDVPEIHPHCCTFHIAISWYLRRFQFQKPSLVLKIYGCSCLHNAYTNLIIYYKHHCITYNSQYSVNSIVWRKMASLFIFSTYKIDCIYMYFTYTGNYRCRNSSMEG